jgi:hypothetical protein
VKVFLMFFSLLTYIKVMQSLDSMPMEEADIWRAENMLKALGVKTEERLNRLVTLQLLLHT